MNLKSDYIYRFPIHVEQQTDTVRLVPNQSENGKYNLILVWFNNISERFLCAARMEKQQGSDVQLSDRLKSLCIMGDELTAPHQTHRKNGILQHNIELKDVREALNKSPIMPRDGWRGGWRDGWRGGWRWRGGELLKRYQIIQAWHIALCSGPATVIYHLYISYM